MQTAVASPALRTAFAFMSWSPERIHALRKRLRLSQTDFGKMLGYSRHQSVSDLERGEMEPSGAGLILLDLTARRDGLRGRERPGGSYASRPTRPDEGGRGTPASCLPRCVSNTASLTGRGPRPNLTLRPSAR